MKNIKNIVLVVLVLLAAYFIYDKITAPENEIQYVDVVIEVPVPGIPGEIQHDTIAEPYEVKVPNPLNNELLQKYNKTKDSLERLKLFTDAITIRNYNEIFEDSIQTINVVSKVQGRLLDQDPTYFVKPRTIILDTVIPVLVPKKFKVFVGAELGIPSQDLDVTNTIIKANLLLKNRKDNIMSFGFDTNKTVWLGYNIKL
tara:strand:+ start:1336 stop:1935 length:600 start_codon:yes stop_codon:yes gene_type:complete